MTDLTIIMPTYNRSGPLHRTLEALDRCDRAGYTAQLIVIDNASKDNTADVVKHWQSRMPWLAVEYLHEPRPGKNHAVNAGLARARGELVIFTDDDVTPEPSWLRQYAQAMRRRPERDIFCGNVTTHIPGYLRRAVINAVSCCHFAPDPANDDLGPDDLPIGANFAIRRRLLETYPDMFDPALGPCGKKRVAGSETVALLALTKLGYRIGFVRDAGVLHRVGRSYFSFSSVCKLSFQQGRGLTRITRFGGGSSTLYGVPRFLYRLFVADVAHAAAGLVSGNRTGALYGIFHALRLAGVAYEWRHVVRTGAPVDVRPLVARPTPGVYVSDRQEQIRVAPEPETGIYESDRIRESVAAET